MQSPQLMNREKACHIKNGTFAAQVADVDETQFKPIPVDWVFKIKHRGGPIDVNKLAPKQFKARLVVRV